MATKKRIREKWVRPRHQVIRTMLGWIFYLMCIIKYRMKLERAKDNRQYLVVFNHQTAFDQFFVSMAFKRPVYFVATEDLFSIGFMSKVLRWLVAPIPFKKSTTDVRAVINCMRVCEQGGLIALSPEGNRTYHGRTCNIKPSIAGLAKKMNLPIAIFRIEGGYGVQPRWSDVTRSGSVYCHISEYIEPEEYADMTEKELYDRIRSGLEVDETKIEGIYKSGRSAEYLERAMYVCPDCGLSEWYSRGRYSTCRKCGRKIEYMPDKTLRAVEGEFPFKYLADWYDYQEDFIRRLDLTKYTETPMYEEEAGMFWVIPYTRKHRISRRTVLRLYGDRIEFEYEGVVLGCVTPDVMRFEDVKVMSAMGNNKLNIYFGDKIYQIKGNKHFNSLKYVNMFYHFVGEKGENNAEFLGL